MELYKSSADGRSGHWPRWAALGVPLGISEPFLRLLQSTSLWLVGAGLATMAACRSLLTHGLAQPWGEVFPRWVPGLGGRRVPPALAIVPATLVAVSVTATGLMFARVVLREGHPLDGWAILGPELRKAIAGCSCRCRGSSRSSQSTSGVTAARPGRQAPTHGPVSASSTPLRLRASWRR
jgi:hypothetical protein